MTNGEWLIQNGYHFSNLVLNTIPNGKGTYYDVYCNGKRVGQIKNTRFGQKGRWNLLNWLDEEWVAPLLTDEQRSYLKAIIEPFRDKVSSIAYDICSEVKTYRLYIFVIPDVPNSYLREYMELPSCMAFEGLEKDKVYTIEDLGL